MTRLKCDVTSCLSNCEGGCTRNGITVTGDCATGACETCCSSFTLSRGGSVNACGGGSCRQKPCGETPVSCTATNCIHNKNGCCGASEIHVSGGGAHAMSQTSCDTFTMRS